MRGYIANTDYRWYDFLRERPDLEEVNFWQPSGGRAFHSLAPGEPIFFKLKKPHYTIAGFGIFVHHSILPAWLAWDSFQEANGTPDFETMIRRIRRYRRKTLDPQNRIGCLMIAQPVFFEEHQWIDQPSDWKHNIVQGKTYGLISGEGRRIYEQCRVISSLKEIHKDISEGQTYGDPVLVQPRLGQGSFRIGVLDAYGRACAVTREHSLPALEAAHIRPFVESRDHRISNGLSLRSDVHRLFDRGYVTVTPDYHFEVSQNLREDFENGRSYYPLHGQAIHVPSTPVDQPDAELLEWHNNNLFLG